MRYNLALRQMIAENSPNIAALYTVWQWRDMGMHDVCHHEDAPRLAADTLQVTFQTLDEISEFFDVLTHNTSIDKLRLSFPVDHAEQAMQQLAIVLRTKTNLRDLEVKFSGFEPVHLSDAATETFFNSRGVYEIEKLHVEFSSLSAVQGQQIACFLQRSASCTHLKLTRDRDYLDKDSKQSSSIIHEAVGVSRLQDFHLLCELPAGPREEITDRLYLNSSNNFGVFVKRFYQREIQHMRTCITVVNELSEKNNLQVLIAELEDANISHLINLMQKQLEDAKQHPRALQSLTEEYQQRLQQHFDINYAELQLQYRCALKSLALLHNIAEFKHKVTDFDKSARDAGNVCADSLWTETINYLAQEAKHTRTFTQQMQKHIDAARPALAAISGTKHIFANIMIAVVAVVSIIGLIPYLTHRVKTGSWLYFNDKPKPIDALNTLDGKNMSLTLEIDDKSEQARNTC